MKKRVITYGTFDLLHEGHINILKKAKGLGEELYVGLSTDSFNLKKGKKARQSFDVRKKNLEKLGFIKKVFAENSWDQKVSDIKSYNIDIFTMGSDWFGKFDFLSKYCKVVIKDRTEGISSTELRRINLEMNFIGTNKIEMNDLKRHAIFDTEMENYINIKFLLVENISNESIKLILNGHNDKKIDNKYKSYTSYLIYENDIDEKINDVIRNFEISITNKVLNNTSHKDCVSILQDKGWILLKD